MATVLCGHIELLKSLAFLSGFPGAGPDPAVFVGCAKGISLRSHNPSTSAATPTSTPALLAFPVFNKLVLDRGIEPRTSAMSKQCSTTELIKHYALWVYGDSP